MSFKTFISLLHLEIMVTKPDSISDEDVLEAFLNAAYESCRGYNLNDKGVDTDLTAPSKPLCLSGSFNKFCEILSPFSPKILHFFVSDSTIMARVKCLFLERLSKHVDDSGQYGRLYEAKQIMDSLKGDDAGDAFETYFDEHCQHLTSAIQEEFLHFKLPRQIDDILLQFKTQAVPYFPSPLSSVASTALTPSFIDWFKAKVETLANQSSSARQQSSIFATATSSQSMMDVVEQSDEEDVEDEMVNLPHIQS
jgi:hypothetical protein